MRFTFAARTGLLASAVGFATVTTGCVSSTHEVALPPLTTMSLERGGNGVSPVSATLSVDASAVRGHVEWAATCQRTMLEQPRTRTVVETRASRTVGVIAAVGAGVLATSAIAYEVGQVPGEAMCSALSHLPSDDPAPSDDGCHGSHTVPAVLGVTSGALLVTSIAMLVSKPTTTFGSVSVGPAGEPRVIGENAACATGPVGALTVALYRVSERVASGSTNDGGDFELPLPSGYTGSLVVVVDAAPPNTNLIHEGEVLGRVNVKAPM